MESNLLGWVLYCRATEPSLRCGSEVSEYCPGNIVARYPRAALYRKLGEPYRVLRDYDEIISLQPYNASVRRERRPALVQAQEGRRRIRNSPFTVSLFSSLFNPSVWRPFRKAGPQRVQRMDSGNRKWRQSLHLRRTPVASILCARRWTCK